MPCPQFDIKGSHCVDCLCTTKTCYICNTEKPLADFRITERKYVLNLKSQKGRCFRCLECEKDL